MISFNAEWTAAICNRKCRVFNQLLCEMPNPRQKQYSKGWYDYKDLEIRWTVTLNSPKIEDERQKVFFGLNFFCTVQCDDRLLTSFVTKTNTERCNYSCRLIYHIGSPFFSCASNIQILVIMIGYTTYLINYRFKANLMIFDSTYDWLHIPVFSF